MIVIPAIDIRKGNCVRLLQGRKEAETIYSDDPAAMAKRWAAQGAERIHVIDLDGAFQKGLHNLDAIKKILDTVSVSIQVGGGIRNPETAGMLVELGVDRVVFGTEAIQNPEMVKGVSLAFPGRVVVGIDARDGLVAIEGWTETTRVRAVELAKEYEDAMLAAIHFTDIYRDGMQTGPNIAETGRLAAATSIPIIASGGVASMQDVEALLPLQALGVEGFITGKALYTGAIRLSEAIAMAKQGIKPPP